MKNILSQRGDEGIDDSRNDVILRKVAQEGMVEDLEPMERACGLRVDFEQQILKRENARLHPKNFLPCYNSIVDVTIRTMHVGTPTHTGTRQTKESWIIDAVLKLSSKDERDTTLVLSKDHPGPTVYPRLPGLGPQKNSTWPIFRLMRTVFPTKKQRSLHSPHRHPTAATFANANYRTSIVVVSTRF
jgi:hypothetical protein